ncbi:hypothetical protein ACS0TY_027680 [Phlomoides rotata]
MLMERTEPVLVPEWLRCTGNVAGGGASVHLSDVSSSACSMRSRLLRSTSGEKECPRYLEKSLSSHYRHSSTSNGSGKHPYSSFSRSRWDRNHDRGKEKSLPEDVWEHNASDPLASILTSRVERSALRRSQSLVARKNGEPLPRRVEDSRISGNGVLSGGSNLNLVHKGVFEKDFPSLGTKEKQCVTGIRRVSSPVLSSAVQSFPIGSSGFLGGEKWTSALAVVPAIHTNNGTGHPHLQHKTISFSSSSSGSSSTVGLNMAEALSQPAARVHANPQVHNKSQRLDELALKQSRQLIPVTPPMPKPLVPSSADKSKPPKIAVRTNEMTASSKTVHPPINSSHLANQSHAQTRSDSACAAHVGKFLVLKPGRDNFLTVAKDMSIPMSDANSKVAKDNQLYMASSTPTTSISDINSFMVSTLENKSAALSLSSKSTLEKKSSQSLTQSRSEFFNLMRRKNSACGPAIHSDSSLDVLSPSAETAGENFREVHNTLNPRVLENGNQIICNGDRYDIAENTGSLSDDGGNSLSFHGSVYPDEEEAAFLRSLGWEENGGEDEGLTEEEINAFYQEYMNRRPSLEEVCQSSPPLKCPTTLQFPRVVSGVASSNSESNAEA